MAQYAPDPTGLNFVDSGGYLVTARSRETPYGMDTVKWIIPTMFQKASLYGARIF
jgi:hypothetical protein